MNTQCEMDSKAGTSRKKNNHQLQTIISKSASSLLIAITGLSLMSFDLQHDNAQSGDTNTSANTELVYLNADCCAAETLKPVKPAIGPKKASISFSSDHADISKADAENEHNFAAEEKERSIWSMNRSRSFAKADKEAVLNFHTSRLYPEASFATKADAQAIKAFGETLLQQSANVAIAGADAEAHNRFWKDNFSITLQYATVAADAEMQKKFADALVPYIAYPSAEAIRKADAELISNQQALIQTATVAIK